MTGPGLDGALAALEELKRRGQRPSHYLARDLLLALGGLCRSEPAEVRSAAARVAVAAGSVEGWSEAVHTELTLACAEFARCLDPRYLGLPGYDLEYTLAARSRLEDRLVAACALGFDLSPREREVLELADRVLRRVRSELHPAPRSP